MRFLVIRARRLGRAEGALKEVNRMLLRRILDQVVLASPSAELTASFMAGPDFSESELVRAAHGVLRTHN